MGGVTPAIHLVHDYLVREEMKEAGIHADLDSMTSFQIQYLMAVGRAMRAARMAKAEQQSRANKKR